MSRLKNGLALTDAELMAVVADGRARFERWCDRELGDSLADIRANEVSLTPYRPEGPAIRYATRGDMATGCAFCADASALIPRRRVARRGNGA